VELLEGEPLHWFSRDYRVRRGSEELTLIDMMFWVRGEFALGGEQYRFRREGLLAPSYVLEHGERVIARAERTRIMPTQYRVTVEDRQLYLKPRLPGRTYLLVHGDRTIGEIRRRRLLFSRAFTAEFREPLALEAEVFIVALVLLRWRARARAK